MRLRRGDARPRAREGRRAGDEELAELSFEPADALALPYEDGAFDAATVAFGARNFEDLAGGLAEMARVVAPGGRIVVLEITTPRKPPLSLFYRLWFDRLVPILGRLAGALARMRAGGAGGRGDVAGAYEYLPSSVRRFPGPEALAAEMARLGLEQVHYILHGRRNHRDPRRHRPRARGRAPRGAGAPEAAS